MRWFKHTVKMHEDIKVQTLIKKCGLEGYGLWNLCLELVGEEGKKGRIGGELEWRNKLLEMAGWSDSGKLTNMLNTLAEIRLINPKALKYGNLYIPNIVERADDYTTRKVRSETEQIPNLYERMVKIRHLFTSIKGWSKDYLSPSDYGQMARGAKELIKRAGGNDELVMDAINWVSQQGYADWNLQTVNKKWPDFMRLKEILRAQEKQGQEAQRKIEKMKQEAKVRIPKEKLDGLINKVLKEEE